jgi:signal transduction histidine kinase
VERVLQIQKLLLRSRRLPWVLLGVTLAILAGAIALTTEQTRLRIRSQIAGRDGAILHAVAQMQQAKAAEAADLVGSMDDPVNQLTVVLETSRLSGVMGARLFDTNGNFVFPFPDDVVETRLDSDTLAVLKTLKPVSRYRAAVRPDEIFLFGLAGDPDGERPVPVLEVNVPLHSGKGGRLVGAAQFIIEGHSIAQEFAQLDRHLIRQALVAFTAGGFILVVAVVWSFRRLNRAHRLLAERTENLLQANQELALAAKTSAVGAVTSHLIHGLKNPLAGLQTFVSGLGASVADKPDLDLQQAIAATRRMQTMINEVVGVLREEEGTGQYELSLAEVVDIISAKVQLLCAQRRVELDVRSNARAVLPNRSANLIALILMNLLQNAVEATPAGKRISLVLARDGDCILAEVHDQGPGFPEGRNVFAPCQSNKDGGSGIGLAISKQLANHLGAGLELNRSSPSGCVFVLSLPSALWTAKTSSVTLTLG